MNWALVVKCVSTPMLERAAWFIRATSPRDMAEQLRAIEEELLARHIAEDEGANAAGGAA